MARHPVLQYAIRVNELLHSFLWPTWFYKHEIYEVPNVVTALLVTYDNQRDDTFAVHPNVGWKKFLLRMSRVKKDWAHFSLKIMRKFSQTDKTMLGWEGRTIYFIKGRRLDHWTLEQAEIDTSVLLQGAQRILGPLILEELKGMGETLPVGRNNSREYEHQVRVAINFLFLGDLGEAKAQVRTDTSSGGVEIRDLICQNRADSGFWKDIKDKYSCSEILFDAKNTKDLTRDDLKDVYSYLKPAIGYWGFIVCRKAPLDSVLA